MLADHVDEPVLLLGSRLGFTGNAVDGSDGLPQPVPGWRQRVRRRFSSDWQRVKGSHWRVTGPVAEKTANDATRSGEPASADYCRASAKPPIMFIIVPDYDGISVLQ